MTTAATASGAGRRAGVEFVSANPTGPLHVGHGRAAAIGDCIARVLDANGWNVVREFYYNDAGVQIMNLALSVQARCRGIAPDDDRLAGRRLSRRLHQGRRARISSPAKACTRTATDVVGTGDADDLDAIRRFAVAYLRREQDADLKAFGVRFDVYYLESSLYADGKVDETTRAADRRRPHVRGRRRAVAAHDRVRRRQGPRDAQVGRHVHVLPAGRRLSPLQVAARLRARDHRARRRSPRLARARDRGPAGARRRHSEELSGIRAAPDGDGHARRRGSEALQARRQLPDAARSHRRSRPRCDALLPDRAQGRFAADLRHRSGARADERQSGLLHPVRACARRERDAPARRARHGVGSRERPRAIWRSSTARPSRR